VTLNEDKEILVRYVLGDLPEEMEERLEQEYFLDQQKWNALRAAEDDLIHDYARGALSEERRAQFEVSFLSSPRNRERVELARMLIDQEARKAPRRPARGSPWSPWSKWLGTMPRRPMVSWIAACLLVAATVACLPQILILAERLRASFSQAQHVHQNSSPAPATSIVADKDAAGLAVIHLKLEPGLSRSSGADNQPARIRFSAVPSIYEFVLDLAQDADPSYTATILTAEQRQILQVAGLKSQPVQNGRIILLRFSQGLSRGDYQIRLQGANRATHFSGLYFFTVR
jgi:hypothetical protein